MRGEDFRSTSAQCPLCSAPRQLGNRSYSENRLPLKVTAITASRDFDHRSRDEYSGIKVHCAILGADRARSYWRREHELVQGHRTPHSTGGRHRNSVGGVCDPARRGRTSQFWAVRALSRGGDRRDRVPAGGICRPRCLRGLPYRRRGLRRSLASMWWSLARPATGPWPSTPTIPVRCNPRSWTQPSSVPAVTRPTAPNRRAFRKWRRPITPAGLACDTCHQPHHPKIETEGKK